MAVLSDFTTIVGDTDRRIGDGSQPRKFNFNTGGRRSSSTAYITLMVKGLTVTSQHPEVHLNDRRIGNIFNNNGGRVHEWQTQIINFSGSDLNDGNNQLEFRGVTYEGGGTDHFDDYIVRSVICHFHQSS